MSDDETLSSWTDLQHDLHDLAGLLDGNDDGQLVLFEVDDCLGGGGPVPCPARGTHGWLVECWACRCDVARGHASRAAVLREQG